MQDALSLSRSVCVWGGGGGGARACVRACVFMRARVSYLEGKRVLT